MASINFILFSTSIAILIITNAQGAPVNSTNDALSQPSTSTNSNSSPLGDQVAKETIDTSTEVLEVTSNRNTSTFSCQGRITGYYADVKLGCRVYHFCTQLEDIGGSSGHQRMSYVCLEGSIFDQKDLNCVREADLNVPCEKAESEYERSNKQFDAKEESQPSLSDNLAANIMMNPLTRFIAG